MMAQKTAEFEYRKKAEELERVVAALQNPDVEIDEATKLYTSGLALVSELETYLKQAEMVVRKHVMDSE